MEGEVIEYRAGNYHESSPLKLPGLTKYSPLTLKRGVIGSLDLFEWIVESARSGPGGKRNVIIHLLNEQREPVFTWRLRNAWVSKYGFGDLKANTSDIAVEIIEVVHEGLTIE
jgi:phage tail-like protein